MRPHPRSRWMDPRLVVGAWARVPRRSSWCSSRRRRGVAVLRRRGGRTSSNRPSRSSARSGPRGGAPPDARGRDQPGGFPAADSGSDGRRIRSESGFATRRGASRGLARWPPPSGIPERPSPGSIARAGRRRRGVHHGSAWRRPCGTRGSTLHRPRTAAKRYWSQSSRSRPDLWSWTLVLPDVDGFQVQQRLVDRGRRLPVLFLDGEGRYRGRKIRGLTIGGDDYVTKPFSLEELVARIRAVLRRRTRPARRRAARLRVRRSRDGRGHARGVARAGRPMELTPTEFNLLRCCMLNPRRVLSKGQILDHVWNYDFGGDASIVRDLHQLPAERWTSTSRPDPHRASVGYVLRLPRGDGCLCARLLRHHGRDRRRRAPGRGRGHVPVPFIVPRPPR